jgi:hypothetical protein
MSIEQIQHNRDCSGEDHGPQDLQDWKKLVNTADRRQDVTGDADEQQIPLQILPIVRPCNRGKWSRRGRLNETVFSREHRVCHGGALRTMRLST